MSLSSSAKEWTKADDGTFLPEAVSEINQENKNIKSNTKRKRTKSNNNLVDKTKQTPDIKSQTNLSAFFTKITSPQSKTMADAKDTSLDDFEAVTDTKEKEIKTSKSKKKTKKVNKEIEETVSKKKSSKESKRNKKESENGGESLEEKTNNKTPVVSDVEDGKENVALTNENAQKKKVNAFQFMMDSRNKSIGSNSPGKEAEKEEESPNTKEAKEKLNARKQKFESWANEKGGFKRKIEEAERDEIITEKLEKRAKRLKKMLSANDEESDKKEFKKRKRVIESSSDSENSETQEEPKILDDNSKIKNTKAVVNKETVSPKTLMSPKGIKKQVGLLNFFDVKAVEKKEKPVKNDNDDIKVVDENSDEEQQGGLIKVKMFSPSIKKKKKKRKSEKLSLKKTKLDEISDESQSSQLSSNVPEETTGNRKEENSYVSEEVCGAIDAKDVNVNLIPDNLINSPIKANKKKKHKIKKRLIIPKIRIKLPSSDDETYSIVSDNSNIDDLDEIDVEDSNSVNLCNISEEDDVAIVEEAAEMDIRRSKRCSIRKSYIDFEQSDEDSVKSKREKNVKVAPVFTNSVPRPKEDPEILQAKREFLLSGVPTSLKKFMQKQQQVIEECEVNYFPLISHIVQKTEHNNYYWNLPSVDLNLKICKNTILPSKNADEMKTLNNTNNKNLAEQEVDIRPEEKLTSFKSILRKIKMQNANYPVIKSFKQLCSKSGNLHCLEPKTEIKKRKSKRGRKSKEKLNLNSVENETLEVKTNTHNASMWTEKYKPMCSDDILGNYRSVLELKKWLQSWIQYSDETYIKKKSKSKNCDSGSEFETTDGESRDSVRLVNNSIIITGPNGCGKSTAIYAICNELGINVLELNASSKRTGKKLLQELQEATQSHQVRNKKPSALAAFLQNNSKEKVKKNNDEAVKNVNESSSKMCLLLVEDVDIVFDQDEGFISALVQLMNTSKRPIALVASDTSSPHLYRFISQYRTIEFGPLSGKILAPWLQILCLVEGFYVDRSTMVTALELNKGDVRKTLLQLQFWVQTGGDNRNDELSLSYSHLIQSENSVDVYKNTDKIRTTFKNCLTALQHIPDLTDDIISQDIHDDDILQENNVEDNLGYLHKNLLTSLYPKNCTFHPVNLGLMWKSVSYCLETMQKPTKTSLSDLEDIYKMCDSLSCTDFAYSNSKLYLNSGPIKITTHTKDSLELSECMEGYNNHQEFVCQWTHELVQGNCKLTQHNFIKIPHVFHQTTQEKRWIQDQEMCTEKFQDILPLPVYNDRRSFSIDYFPALRNISRSEYVRANSTVKRNNRFYNYLESLGVNANESTLKIAREMLVEPKF